MLYICIQPETQSIYLGESCWRCIENRWRQELSRAHRSKRQAASAEIEENNEEFSNGEHGHGKGESWTQHSKDWIITGNAWSPMMHKKEKVKKPLKRDGINFEDDGDVTCPTCIQGKQHRASYRRKLERKPASPGEIDRKLEARIPSFGGDLVFSWCSQDTILRITFERPSDLVRFSLKMFMNRSARRKFHCSFRDGRWFSSY